MIIIRHKTKFFFAFMEQHDHVLLKLFGVRKIILSLWKHNSCVCAVFYTGGADKPGPNLILILYHVQST